MVFAAWFIAVKNGEHPICADTGLAKQAMAMSLFRTAEKSIKERGWCSVSQKSSHNLLSKKSKRDKEVSVCSQFCEIS